MVSIHRPLGYGPSTLPLRHSAYLLCFSPAIVLLQAGLQERPLFRSHPRASESWKMVYWKLLVPIASAKSPVRILRNFIRSRSPVFFFNPPVYFTVLLCSSSPPSPLCSSSGASSGGSKTAVADSLYDPSKQDYHPVDDACWQRGQK